MFFVILGWDRQGQRELRRAVKRRHMAHLDAGGLDVTVRQSGPLLDEHDSEAGSLIIVEAPDRAAVERFAAADPYVEAGLFARRSVHPWSWRRGNPFLQPDDIGRD